MIPKPQYLKPLRLQPCTSFSIVRNLFSVLSPIQLDNQTLLKTYEINNVPPDRLLSAKLAPYEPVCAKLPP